jgi:YVTN family beta-propeller protein
LVVLALGAQAASAVPALSASGWTAYVTNNNLDAGTTVTPISTATNTAGTAITVGTGPFGVAITPDGKTAYVANFGGSGTAVTPIDTATNTAGSPIAVGASSDPHWVAVTPDGKTAYVVTQGTGSLTPINTATNTTGTPIPVGTNPQQVAVTPDGKTAYVTNFGDGTVTPISTATNTAGTPITVGSGPGSGPVGIAITPNGKTAYVNDDSDGTVTPINTATNTAGTPITVAANPDEGIAITADGETVYVASTTGHAVTPINTATNTAGTAVPLPSGSVPEGIAITPDGKMAYVVTDGTNSVTPINTATNTTGTPIAVGSGPLGIAITPDQAPTAAFSVLAAPAGQSSSFDGSASSSPVGSIASYQWDFGDGQTATTTTPTTTHVYTQPGAYTAVLTVTNTAGTSTTQVFTGQTVSRQGGRQATASNALTISTATQTALSANPSKSRPKQTVTLTATVTAASGAPFGSVQFLDGATPMSGCTSRPLNSLGAATCDVSYTTVGVHTITAKFLGSTFDLGSTSSPLTVSIVTPLVSGLSVSPREFSIGGRLVGGRCVKTTMHNSPRKRCTRPIKLKVSYTLNIADTVAFTIKRESAGRKLGRRCVTLTKSNRKHKQCARLISVPGHITKIGAVGANQFTFNGTIGGHKLAPGTYQLIATPNQGRPRRVTFKLA